MRLQLFAIMDTCSGVYDGPFKARANGEAVRMFKELCFDERSRVSRSPEDYHLVRIGSYDDGKGMLVDNANEVLVSGVDVVAESRQILPGSLGNGDGNVVPVREADSNEDAHGFVQEEDIVNAS